MKTYLKKFFCLGLVGVMLILGGAKQVFAAEINRTIKVGVYDNNPKIYRENNGKISGLFADILDFIAIQEDWKLDYVYGTWDEGLKRLEKGDVDIMVDVAISEERQKKFDFTNETVLGSWGVVYIRKDSPIVSFKDLNDKKIAILKSSVYLEGTQGITQYINSFNLKVDLVEANEYPEVFNLLDQKKVDAAVVSRIFGSINNKNYPNLKATDIFFDPTELRFALTKGNPDNPYLIERLDYWLKRIRGGYNNFYQHSLEKYGLAGMVVQKEVVPKWVSVVTIIVSGILMISLLAIAFLRRTREIIARQLRQKEFLLGNIVNHMPIFVVSVDQKGLITLIEGKGVQLSGFKPDQIIGKPAAEVFKDNKSIVAGLNKAITGENIEFKTELGKQIWLVNLSPLKEEEKVISVVGTGFDFTEKDRLDKAKVEFIYLASHHLRTPPTQIKWCQELLWPKIKNVLDEKDLILWNGIAEANSRIIDMANAFSLTSWLELTTFSTLPEKFNMTELMDDEIEKINILINEKKIELSKDYQNIPEIYIDRKQVRTIIRSLLTNAARYTPTGGSIKVQLKLEKKHLVISVQDSGWGIPKDQQDKIFTRLFRADNVAKKDPTGIGLALYISKAIVEKLGGKIWFESEEDQGSTFHVELPFQSPKK